LSQAGTVQISYVLTIYFISQEQNNGGFVHNSLSEKKCTVGKHKPPPAYHKPGSHKGKSPYALIPNGNNMMKPYHTLSGRHGMHFSPVSSHMKKDRKDVFSPVSVFCSPLRCNSAGRGQPLNLYMSSRHVHMTSLNNINRTFTGLKGKMKYCGHFNRNIQTHQKCSLTKKQNKGSNCFETRDVLYILTKR
jgi:hypothetical protein